MAWTNIPTASVGDLLGTTWYSTHFKANMEYLKDLADLVGCKATRTTNLAVGASSETTITLPTEDFDTDTMHDTVTNSERVVAPYDGEYLIIAEARYNAAGQGVLRVYDNNANIVAVQGANQIYVGLSCSVILQLSANDYVYMTIQSTNAGNVNPAMLTMVRLSNQE